MSSLVPSLPGIGSDLTSLSKARFALVGFGPDESRPVVAALAEWGSLSRAFYPQVAAQINQMESYSAVILNLTARLNEAPWIADPRFLTLEAPLIAVGTCEQFNAFPTIDLNASEVIFRPFSAVELGVRLRRCIDTLPRRDKEPRRLIPRVLIADDDPSIVAIVSRIFQGRGFDCREATNGKQALELTRHFLPDLLILDVNMPFVNGFDVLSALRGDPSTSAMKILMLTGSYGNEDVIRGVELGATGYLCKPFQPFDFVLRIKELFPSFDKNAKCT